MTLMRSGTIMTQELVWLLLNNLDFEKAKMFIILQRTPEFKLVKHTIIFFIYK